MWSSAGERAATASGHGAFQAASMFDMLRLGLFTLVLAAAGCSEAPPTSTCLPGLEDCDAPTPADEIVAGVNLTALFADATAAEIAAASGRRPAGATAGTVEVTPLDDAPDGARRFRLGLRDGADTLVNAVARIPGPASLVSQLPVVVVLTDDEDGAEAEDALTDGPYATLAERTVQVVVAYRGEALQVGDSTLVSSSEADPYRADVADVLALLPALPILPRADASRLGVVGLGRGGTVALLAALATPQVDAVVTLGAPTDLLGASFRADARTRLQNRTVATPYPAFDALVAPVVALRDGAIEADEARLRLLALSPGYAGAGLPAVLALHAVGDAVVGADQLTRLDATMTSEPGTSRTARQVEGASHDTLADDLTVQSDIAAFLLDAL